jgi:hypothetical protein
MQSTLPGSIRLLCRRAIQSFVRPPLRLVRPSVLCPRLEGDPWVETAADGSFAVCVDDCRLAQVAGVPFDGPSLNHVLDRLRHTPPRRQRRPTCLRG